MKKLITFLVCLQYLLSIHLVFAVDLIQPDDLNYLGAFRLPDVSDKSEWIFSGYAMTCYPDGDPENTDDYPGSIFALGHDHHQMVSEISIPIPIISENKNPADLNTAETLQSFADITGGAFSEQEIPRMGIEYIPATDNLPEGLYYCRGEHNQDELMVSHGYCTLDLSDPQSQGPWYFNNYSNYTTNDYLFAIQLEWANTNTPGQFLASGRFRDGGWGGLGPALFAFSPLVNSYFPATGDTVHAITPLLMYGEHYPGNPVLVVSEDKKMNWYKEPDEWSGGAWLSGGERSALIFVGTKAMGNTWYGFSDGTVWPQDPPYPEIPEWPHNERGWWADSINAVILFYDPADLADVANGVKNTWEPQPYAMLNINEYLFSPGYDYGDGKMTLLGSCSFDRTRGLLYINERRADEEKSLIHVFEQTTPSTRIDRSETFLKEFELLQIYPNPLNPFNPQTRITFLLTKDTDVTIRIYDILGRSVKTLLTGTQHAGNYQLSWKGDDDNGIDVSSGVYLVILKADNSIKHQKVTLLK